MGFGGSVTGTSTLRRAVVAGAAVVLAITASAFQQSPAPTAIVDAGAKRAPMSKYIYDQFIKHLNHCIYNGI